MIKLKDILFEGKLSKSEIKKMKDKFDKTGKLPPHLQKLADLMKKNTKVKDIVVPGLEWMAEEKLTEVSGATRMGEKEWTMIHSKLKPNKKIIIQYKDRKGKNTRGFYVIKKVKDLNTIQIGKQKPVKGEFNNYELKWRDDKVWLWAAMGHAKNRTDKGIKDIIVR